MEQQILDALREQYPDIQGDIELTEDTALYNGRILTESFQGMSFVERQHSVFKVLRKVLGPKVKLISMLFTYTPEEYDLLQAA